MTRLETVFFLLLLFLGALALGYAAKAHDLESALSACKAERPLPPPKCRFNEDRVREAVAGWEGCTDIATTCVIDSDLCRQNLKEPLK